MVEAAPEVAVLWAKARNGTASRATIVEVAKRILTIVCVLRGGFDQKV